MKGSTSSRHHVWLFNPQAHAAQFVELAAMELINVVVETVVPVAQTS